MPEVTVNDTTIHYAHCNAGKTRNLVLIHGSGGECTSWPLRVLNMDQVNVYAIDLPGHGRSGGEGLDSVDAYTDVVMDFVETLGLSNVVVGGHSLGGAVALTIGLRKPHWLAGLVLVGTGGRLRVHPAIFTTIADNFDEAIGLVGKFSFGPDVTPDVVDRAREMLTRSGPQVLLGDFGACDHFDVMDRLGEIDVPTLVVSGTHDQLTPEKYGKHMADSIAGAKFAIVADAGHMMALEKPDAFHQALVDFLS